jgi:phage replication initiation protein
LPEHSWRRADIAADFFQGEVTHERVKQAHRDGKFARGGRGPALGEILSSDEDQGRTIYIGKRGSDALGRFYEKGKKEYWSGANKALRAIAGSPNGVMSADSKLNGAESFDLAKWYRAELELRAKNRPIPDDWISKRDQYFAGAYPFLEEILPEAEPRRLLRPRDAGIAGIERALATIKRQWGPTLYTGLEYCGGDYVALCLKILGEHHSPRLIAAGALLALAGEPDANA